MSKQRSDPPTPAREGLGGSSQEKLTEELVLAALQRAALHRAKASAAVPFWAIAEHLGVAPRSAAARRLRSRLEALLATGSLEQGRQHGVPMWTLTAGGRERLRRMREAGSLPPLPESPQHRAWRAARTVAAQEIERFATALGEALAHGASLLELEPPAPSEAWFALGERLQSAAWRLGSASYCLHEWAEPQDDRADVDDHADAADEPLDAQDRERRRARRLGRRNVRLWQDWRDC